jgi:two-component SAPR family response regulator
MSRFRRCAGPHPLASGPRSTAHALAAFDANSVAYPLKPVTGDRLRTVVARIEQLVRTRHQFTAAST